MKYISLLRGINVSGQKKILMNDLKSLYQALGFQNVITYIQSGNVIFDATNKKKTELKAMIESAIKYKYKFHAPVEIRTNPELINIIKNCPFDGVDLTGNDLAGHDLAGKGTKILVTFLSDYPSKLAIKEVLENVIAPDKLIIEGKEVYLFCPGGYGKSKLNNIFLERKLGVEATTRNWKSVHKLSELSKQ